MTTPLLMTKLYIPPARPELVSRRRLIDRLSSGLHRKLTLVSAPAGFGKTTLLSEWVASPERLEPRTVFAWLSLDDEDNDPVRFWTYLIAALQMTDAGRLAADVAPASAQALGQEALQILRWPQLPPAQAFLTPLLNDVTAVADRVVLILDDYQVISAQAVHDGIAFLLDHQPQQLHLVLATRTDPALPIVRLRARGQLTELRADDLRFTPDEATGFLNEMMGLALVPQDVKALESRTEGWIAGLQLAAIALQSQVSMQGRAKIQEFISAFTGSHHYMLEYLTEEVVSCQPERVRRFLLQTSVLDRLCGPLCDAVTGENDGDAILAYLYRNNLFVVPLDDEHYWYRYHHLFADLLRKSQRQGMAPARVLDLHCRASQWYEHSGSLDKAVAHALEAEDLGRVACLAEQAIQANVLDSRLTTLLRWLQALPEELLHTRPRLRMYQGWALFLDGQLDLAARMMQGSRRSLENLSPSAENDALRVELTQLLDTMAAIALALTHGLGGDIDQSIQLDFVHLRIFEELERQR